MNYGGDDSLHVTLIGFVLLLFMQLACCIATVFGEDIRVAW